MTRIRFALAVMLLGLSAPAAALAQGAADPNATRLFFGPTARTLQRGQVKLTMNEVLAPTLQVGVTDRVSIGAGTPLIPGLVGYLPAWVTPKVQLYSGGRTAVAAGVIHFFVPGADPDVGIAYGNATVGTNNSALTAGVGYAYTNRPGHGATAVAMIGGEHRAGPRFTVMTENYFWRGGGLMICGLRRVYRGGLSAEAGLLAPLGQHEPMVAPFANLAWVIR